MPSQPLPMRGMPLAQVENAPPVQLVSSNLNISLERRDAGAAVASPFGCPTVNGQETLAQVPRSVLGSEDDVGAVMWTSAGDVHAADPVVNMSLVGPPTSFTLYTAETKELEVKDSPDPVMLSLSLSPDSKKRAAKSNDTLECRYFEEELGEWSTEGCVTVDLDGNNNLGCHCGHLSDFIAVKIPTKFEGEITFANLDTTTEVTLHCACTKGVRVRINKGIGDEPELTKLDVAIADMGYSAWNKSVPFASQPVWRFVDAFYSGRERRNDTIYWLDTNGTQGLIDLKAGQGNMQLLMDPTGLAETSLQDAYLADLIIDVQNADGEFEQINISITAAVSVMAAAPKSVWGHVVDGALCEPVYTPTGTPALNEDEARLSNGSYPVLLGDLVRIPFTACDSDAIPVTHRLPRAEVGDLPGDSRQFEPSIARAAGPTFAGIVKLIFDVQVADAAAAANVTLAAAATDIAFVVATSFGTAAAATSLLKVTVEPLLPLATKAASNASVLVSMTAYDHRLDDRLADYDASTQGALVDSFASALNHAFASSPQTSALVVSASAVSLSVVKYARPPELFVKYVASGRYNVLAMVHSGLGEHLLDVSLDGINIAFSLPIKVVCTLDAPTPSSLYPLPSNETCGCNVGYEPAAPDADEPCTPCPAGHYKDTVSMDSCSPCPSGSFQSFLGQEQCLPCGRGTFAGGSGSELCEPCGPGTGSEPGARICDPCPPGTFALGGEKYCQLCRPGTYNPDEGQMSCTRCPVNQYAGDGFIQCRACGLFDKKQLTVKPGEGIDGCDLGVMNGTLPGFWAAQTLDDDSGNWTRVWKCETKGVCLGGVDSECRVGHGGPLCDYCLEGFYDDGKHLCEACPPDVEKGGDAALAQVVLLCMLFGFCMGNAANLLFFKSDVVDAWANFFYRVRTNPLLFIAQIWAIRNTKKAAARKVRRANEAAAAATPPPSPPAGPYDPEAPTLPASPPDAPAAGDEPSHAPLTRQQTAAAVGVLKATLKRNAETIAQMFKDMDEDGNGMIQKTEFAKTIPELGIKCTKAEIDAIFDEIDEDRSGEIDPGEFANFFGIKLQDEAEAAPKSSKRYVGGALARGSKGEPLEDTFKAAPAAGAAGGKAADGKAAPAKPDARAKPAAPAGQPKAPDMLSLSLSLVIVVKFILFDLTGYLQVNSSMSSSMPGLKWPPVRSCPIHALSHHSSPRTLARVCAAASDLHHDQPLHQRPLQPVLPHGGGRTRLLAGQQLLLPHPVHLHDYAQLPDGVALLLPKLSEGPPPRAEGAQVAVRLPQGLEGRLSKGEGPRD